MIKTNAELLATWYAGIGCTRPETGSIRACLVAWIVWLISPNSMYPESEKALWIFLANQFDPTQNGNLPLLSWLDRAGIRRGSTDLLLLHNQIWVERTK